MAEFSVYEQQQLMSGLTDQQKLMFQAQYQRVHKNRNTMLFLSIFLGLFAVDRFVLGKVWTGLLKFFTAGGWCIWWLIDAIRIRHMTDTYNRTKAYKILAAITGAQAVPASGAPIVSAPPPTLAGLPSESFTMPPVPAKGSGKGLKIALIAVGSVFALFVVLVIIGVIIGGNGKPQEGTVKKAAVEPAKTIAGYTLDSKENMLLSRLLDMDAASFARGGESTFGGGAVNVIADNVVADEADRIMFRVRVFGTVDSVNGEDGNTPYVMLRGRSHSIQTTFNEYILRSLSDTPDLNTLLSDTLNPQLIERIKQLKKGQQVVLMCERPKVADGTVQFSDCVFADDYAQAVENELKEFIPKMLDGREKTTQRLSMVIEGMVLSKTIPENSPCYLPQASTPKILQDCSRDLTKARNSPNFKPALLDAVNLLKTKGVDVSVLEKSSSSSHGPVCNDQGCVYQ
ncbi:MAG: TM2 domain-containing protein [Acidobacteriaceae bacterium]|nr:TM2 domain-containing protein [Acidobacteriaceae bacterium]